MVTIFGVINGHKALNKGFDWGDFSQREINN
jgi:hypothetical protein